MDSDCTLLDDCCACDGVPLGAVPGVCDAICDQPRCTELGITAAVCRFGVCISERLRCDANLVVCAMAPPECPPGSLPETTPECWSGRCVPAGYCDVISECGLCPADTLCAEIKSCAPQSVRCEPLPLACAGVPSCECIGDQICANLGICGINEGVLDCYCPL